MQIVLDLFNIHDPHRIAFRRHHQFAVHKSVKMVRTGEMGAQPGLENRKNIIRMIKLILSLLFLSR